MSRSVSADLELEPGNYSVLMKITAKKWPTDPSPEQIIKQTCKDRPEKLTQVGLAYDLAHAKGQIKETEKEKKRRQEREEKKKAATKKKMREAFRTAKLKQWQLEKKIRAREKRHAKRKEDHERKKAEKQKSAEPQDVPVNGANTTPDINGDVTSKTQPEKATIDGAGMKTQATEPQSNGPAAPAPLPDDALSKEHLTNGISTESEITKPQANATVVVPNNLADKPTEAKPIAEALIEAKPVDETEAEQFHNALQTIPSIQANGGSIGPTPALAPSTMAGPDDWQYDSDASFNSSIDSDLDFPPEPSSSEVLEEVAAGEDDENAEFADDPWNAVCVVGLRVYSMDSGLCVEIVRPRHDEEDGDTPLDVDDASKGASVETVAETVGRAGEKA